MKENEGDTKKEFKKKFKKKYLKNSFNKFKFNQLKITLTPKLNYHLLSYFIYKKYELKQMGISSKLSYQKSSYLL